MHGCLEAELGDRGVGAVGEKTDLEEVAVESAVEGIQQVFFFIFLLFHCGVVWLGICVAIQVRQADEHNIQ